MSDRYEVILQFFGWEHLQPHLQEVSRPFGEMAHDGYGYAYGGPLTGEVLLVSLRDVQDNPRFMLVFPDETACQLKTLDGEAAP